MQKKEDVVRELSVRDKTIDLDLWYPRADGNINAVELGLVDVRAADSIRIIYDFDRDGWSISQATIFEWEIGEEPERGWKEVAFVKAWSASEH